MTEIQSITTASWEHSPPQLKSFPIIIPEGVIVNKIYACIRPPGSGRDGILSHCAGHFHGCITLDLSKAFPNTEFVVLGFRDRTLVAEYVGIATDLERFDLIQLRRA
ncbi:MAG: hypothetical protein KR126chlam3_01579 [Chlamydiae bacterium]|nr:hypothetical protein [Chlamydiota bacterium]